MHICSNEFNCSREEIQSSEKCKYWIKVQLPQIVLKNSTWVNVLSYFIQLVLTFLSYFCFSNLAFINSTLSNFCHTFHPCCVLSVFLLCLKTFSLCSVILLCVAPGCNFLERSWQGDVRSTMLNSDSSVVPRGSHLNPMKCGRMTLCVCVCEREGGMHLLYNCTDTWISVLSW